MRRHLASSMFVSMVSLVGCSVGSSSSAEPNTSSAESIPASLDGQALPIEAVLVVNSGAADALHSAVDALSAECMTEHGLAYIAYPEDKLRSNPFELASRYGHLTVESADQFGYHNPLANDLVQFDAVIAGIDAKREVLSREYNDVLYGSTRADGCFSLAVAEVYGQSGGVSGMDGFQQLVNLQSQGSQEAAAEPRVVEAMKSWSRCMADAGYTYPTIYDARGPFPSAETDLTPPSAEERTQAIADARCRSESRIELILFAAESTIENSLLEQSPDLVSNFKHLMDDAVLDAQRLVSRQSAPNSDADS